ncbi:oxidoreductase [Aliihoeflea aestuarii]|jgi:predicted oxidoreductase|uniref:aldo/keto reductase n=1 Tax=Aliihoeflea aestuarii TaxID=453840 RepID=UPI002093E1F6|nr:aldo/keto reductase [Aliihoeflea aestuarii]MCO6389613.1 oxidoreductase [Aliihoeflea aestuarii]
MERVQITPDLSFSRLVYGLWRLADDEDTSARHVREKVESCLAQGITTMDHADIYGGYAGEKIFGDALRDAPELRDRIEIVTKCDIVAPMGRYESARVKHYDTSEAHIRSSVEQSLHDLGVERIDLLLIHRPDPLMDHVETGRALDHLVASGKVRAVGVSNFRPWDVTLLQSAMSQKLVANQIELSLVEHRPFTNGDLAFVQERGIVPMAWSPLGGGGLFTDGDSALSQALGRIAGEQGVEASAVAVAWLLRHPARILPVLGTNRLERIARIAEAMTVEIDRQTWFELYSLAIGHEVP